MPCRSHPLAFPLRREILYDRVTVSISDIPSFSIFMVVEFLTLFEEGKNRQLEFATWCDRYLSSTAQLIPLVQAAKQLDVQSLLALATQRVRVLIRDQDSQAIRTSFDLLNWTEADTRT